MNIKLCFVCLVMCLVMCLVPNVVSSGVRCLSCNVSCNVSCAQCSQCWSFCLINIGGIVDHHCLNFIFIIHQGPSWSWSYGSWIYNYSCNQCLLPLKLWVRTPFIARCTNEPHYWLHWAQDTLQDTLQDKQSISKTQKAKRLFMHLFYSKQVSRI
jgi:hypothetical protein